MNKRIICGLLTFALLAGIGYAAAKEVPMRGNGSGIITSATPGQGGLVITATGEGEATHLGKFTRQEEILLNPENFTLTGTIVFTAADGSELHCSFAGAFTGQTTAAGTYTITGGTGRFENATGSAYFAITQSDPANFTFEFAGTIELH